MTRKKSSDFHGGIRFQSSFKIRWELEDTNFLKIDIICLDDSLKYRIMAIKTNENFIPFSILGDPGADKGSEGKSKRAEKYIWNEEK